MRALVVFCDPADARLQWALKPGFRHCFCCVASGDYWIRLDAETGKTLIEVIADSRFDLAGHFRKEGWTVVETEQREEPLRTPFVSVNCVGLVKAILNIRAPWAITPWRLHKFLTKEQPKCVS